MLSREQKGSGVVTHLPARSLLEVCKAAAEPLRLDIIRLLSKGSFGVQELSKILGVPQPGVSHHLKILASHGLLATRRQGNSIFYRRALRRGDSPLESFQSSLFATVDAEPLEAEYLKRMAQVLKERSERSQEFFERNAQRFEESQGMLCEPSQYFSHLTEMLDLMALARKSRVMEVGPGQGQLLQELAKRYDQVVALDDSGEMLALAQGKLKTKAKKIEFVNCSLEAYAAGRSRFDAVILNMVMHHMPSPERAFQKLATLVEENGFVLVADLCSHDQEWTKESCGDVWLGLDPEDLNEWAANAGFSEKESSYLGLQNGFQIQLKLFAKDKS